MTAPALDFPRAALATDDVPFLDGADHTSSDAARIFRGDEPRTELVVLSDRWRVIDDRERQWVLQRCRGGRWRDVRYHTEVGALLRSIRELCSTADLAAVAVIAAWPATFAAFARVRAREARAGGA